MSRWTRAGRVDPLDHHLGARRRLAQVGVLGVGGVELGRPPERCAPEGHLDVEGVGLDIEEGRGEAAAVSHGYCR